MATPIAQETIDAVMGKQPKTFEAALNLLNELVRIKVHEENRDNTVHLDRLIRHLHDTGTPTPESYSLSHLEADSLMALQMRTALLTAMIDRAFREGKISDDDTGDLALAILPEIFAAMQNADQSFPVTLNFTLIKGCDL